MAPSFIRTPSAGPSAPQRPPGPAGLPWLGQLPAFFSSKFFPKKMLSWAQEYKGVYSMELAGKQYLVVAEPSLLPGIVGRGSQGLPKSDGYSMWDPLISPHAGVQGLFTVSENTDTWRVVRRAYGPAVGPGTMGFHFPITLRCASKFGRVLESLGGSGATSLELNRLFKALTLDMLGLTAFGVDLGCLDDPLHAPLLHHFDTAFHECGERGRGVGRRLAPWLYAEERRRGEESLAAIHAWVDDIWGRIKARGPPAEDDRSMAAQLARLADPSNGSEALSGEQVRAEIATLLVAGYETVANTMTWLMFSLYAYPDKAAKLEEELRDAGILAAAGCDGATGDDDRTAAALEGLPGGHEAVQALPYLDAYIREGLRMFSIAPNGLIKQVPLDGSPVRIGPYEAAPGEVVWVPMWALHMSERNWERPLEFHPERWIGRDPRSAGPLSTSRCPVGAAVSAFQSAAAAVTSTTSTANAQPAAGSAGGSLGIGSDADTGTSPAAAGTQEAGTAAVASPGAKIIRYIPFGDGSRNCVGQHLAMLELKVLLSYLVGRYRWRLDERRMVDAATVLDRQRVNLTLEIEGGMWMHAVPRG